MLNIVHAVKTKLSDRIKSAARSKVIRKFIEKNGLVYFGFVNQHSDEHKVVRGFTVSATHKDDNYSVGNVNGYNVTVVDRKDKENYKGKPLSFSRLIIAIDLNTDTRIPHFLIKSSDCDNELFHPFFSSFPNMVEADDMAIQKYGNDFNSRFKLYVRPAKLDDLQQLLTIDMVRVLSAHLWPYSIEQHDNVLYVYSNDPDISEEKLTQMLKNGLYLAYSLDSV